METVHLTREQARRFLLRRHGLLGGYRFEGKRGVLEFVKQEGCIQFDPVNVCGRSPELVLLSRVKGFTKQMLYELLYQDRVLIDYFDKNLSIFATEDWPYFECYRDQHRQWERSHADIETVSEQVKGIIAERGAVCSADLDMPGKVHWYWSDTKLSRAALEHLYFTGDLAVHHKKGTVKYYDLISRCVPEEILNRKDPLPNEQDHQKWRVLRRIRSVGLLWNRPSDAWLNITNLNAAGRRTIFESLLKEHVIVPVSVEGIPETFYMASEDLELAEACGAGKNWKKRCEFLAPLDNLLWDRNLIRMIFDFDYKWEIYTPVEKRKYGHYVLPILYGDRLIGRIEAPYDRKEKQLNGNNIWYEPGVRKTAEMQRALNGAVERLAEFNRGEVSGFTFPPP